MVFKPLPCQTRWEGIAVSFWILLLDLLLLVWMARRPVDWMKFFLLLLVIAGLPLLFHLIYRTWAGFSLAYWVDRNAITLQWANLRYIIPLDNIQRVIGRGVQELGRANWTNWPTPHLRRTRALGLLNITMAATRPLDECLLIDTGNAVFAISPRDTEQFLTALQERYRLGAVQNVQLVELRISLWDRIFQNDKLGPILIGMGLAGVLALFGVVMIPFPNLPDALAFHYNSSGIPDVVRDKTALFLLPGVGLFAWTLNGVWGIWMAAQQQRTGAYMLWGGAIIVQLFSFLALTSLMR